MVALLYLKHTFNESDEDVIQRWGETPIWQYFYGNEYFEHQLPCDPTQLGRFRKAMGEEGVEELLARTMAVECISKGKSRNPYKFGAKVGLAMTLKGNMIVGARSFPSNPYDWHTMHEQIEKSAILMQGLGIKPEVVYTDLGYRGVDKDNLDI